MKTRLRIKEIAAEKGVSLTRLSQRSEVAYNTVRKLFRDPYAEVTLSTLQRLADVLGVSVRDLLEDVADDKPE
jgi:DNA-binding Xre family transcriptional regulator